MRFGFSDIAKAQRRFLCALLMALAIIPVAAQGQDALQVEAETLDGFGRMILTFPGRLDLPEYELRAENGVLSIEFSDPVDVSLPDIPVAMPDLVAISRVDPDSRGIRFGLRSDLRINKIEAGEQLYVDLLPPGWVGQPPPLPQEVVNLLAQRAQDAAELAEQQRKAELARLQNPTVEVRVGQNPTFVRLEFDWNVDTTAEFSFDDGEAKIQFGWPVSINLYPLDSNRPPEILQSVAAVTPDGNELTLELADGVEPRFYKISEQEYVLDMDRLEPVTSTISAEDLLAAAEDEAENRRQAEADDGEAEEVLTGPDAIPETELLDITPEVKRIGSSVRITFPFDVETPAAVYRRGDMVWMVFDTTAAVNAPAGQDILSEISDDFSTISAGDTQIVRMQLDPDKLASLGSQGLGWVISVGDMVLAPSEPISLNRRRLLDDTFEIAADLGRPARLHEVRDPMVGDILEVVTMFPPARGLVRDLSFVDFDALKSVHGFVIRPVNESLAVDITQREAVISAEGGLNVSSYAQTRTGDFDNDPSLRVGFVDLKSMEEPNLGLLSSGLSDLVQQVAISEGRERDTLRLQLAQVYLANQFGQEALGMLDIVGSETSSGNLFEEAQIARAAALVTISRPDEALTMLNSPALTNTVDGLMWRAIARSETEDFEGARLDILASESVIGSYPQWVSNKFLLSGVEAAVETRDLELAHRLVDRIVFSQLNTEEASRFELLQGRIDELSDRNDEALDTYGRVIAADVRPTRAEAVYRTVALLDRMGRLDATKAAETLATESMVWRGGPVEGKMLELQARLQFRSGDYRGAFTTVKQISEARQDTDDLNELNDLAQEVFADLYLNGEADGLEPIDALTLYYDFRQLTPPGARGDEMVRNLARRLIRVDLLEQAAELLEYQIDTRLEGAARAQVAADLAVVYLADRSPEQALDVLNRTALVGISASLERQRRILEARALVDAGRSQLALDVLRNLDGRDADVMRIDALWRDGLYREAAEQIELMYSQRGVVGELSQVARRNIIKAGAGFVLGNDRIGLMRLRSKFAEAMADSPEWAMFDYVTGQVTQTSEGFRELAGEIASRESLSSFLEAYRQTYGADGALSPLHANDQGS